MYNRTLEERIAAKVERADNGCLVWIGSKNRPNGYGQIWVIDRLVQSHRAVWELTHGPIAAGMFVDHLCHTRLCCEITHLRLVSDAINKQNRAGAQANSALGIRGVYRVASGKFKARVQVGGRVYGSPPVNTVEEAVAESLRLRAEHHEPIPSIRS